MREDSNPDIIILVEDSMAKNLFHALKQRYTALQNETDYLDIRILEIGGFQNVVHFYVETNNYLFYDNVYVAAFMDKDVETDIVPYSQFGNQETIQQYRENAAPLHFLPYTPEVLLVETFYTQKDQLLRILSATYDNQQLQYSTPEIFDFADYDAVAPAFQNQTTYNNYTEKRGNFRKRCKLESQRISKALAEQVNQSIEEIYRIVFKYAVDNADGNKINVRELLAQTMKRFGR